MKKIFTLLFAAMCCVLTANAERVKSGDLYYEIDKDAKTAVITYETESTDGSNYSSITELTIYPKATIDGVPYDIIGIGEKAFHSNNTIELVYISPAANELKTIGNYAFNNATALRSISFRGPGLESIGDHAFYGCAALQSIELPPTLKTIDQYAFCNCKAMKLVMISEGTTTIGTCAFRWCEGLQVLRLPSTLTSIGDFAFQNCKALKEMHCHLAAPLDLGTNAQYTFANAPETAKVYVGGSASDFRNAAGWSVLPISDEQLVTSNNLYYIINPSDNTAKLTWDLYQGSYFNYFTIEGAVTIPSTISVGGKSYTVTALDVNALYRSKKLTEIFIPDEVISIGNYAFYECQGLKTMHLPGNLKEIPYCMCSSCALEEIVIPESVEEIEDLAFMYCVALKTVTNYNPTPISIDEDVFGHVPYKTDVTLKVPFGSKSDYEAADVWKDFFAIEEMEQQGIEQPTSDSSLKGRGKKLIKNGQLLIERNGKTYNALGAEVK